jgi:hypothetical protein
LDKLLALVDGAAHRDLSISAWPVVSIIIPNDAATWTKRALALGSIETSVIGMVRTEHLWMMYVLLVVSILRSSHI